MGYYFGYFIDFFSNIFLFIWIELFAFGVFDLADYYFKTKNCKTIKKPVFFVKTRHFKEKNVSLFSFWFQILNYLFSIGWLVFAILEVVIYKSYWLSSICRYILWFYGASVFVVGIVIGSLAPIKKD